MPAVVSERRTLSLMEEEQELVKKLQPTSAQPISPVLVSPEKSFAFLGSIQPSTLERLPQFRPQLPWPEAAFPPSALARIVQCQVRSDELMPKFFDLFEESIDQKLKRLDEIQEELKVALEAEHRTENLETKWHTLETLLQYLTTAGSIVLGAGLMISGTDQNSGAFLIAAGALGLVNQLMTDSRGWQTLISYFTESVETQKTIESQIQTGMFLVSLGLSLTSGALALHTGTLQQVRGEDYFAAVTKIIQISTTLLTTGTKITSAAIRKRSCDIQAKMIRLQTESSCLRKTIEGDNSDLSEEQRKIQYNISVVKRAIEQLSTAD